MNEQRCGTCKWWELRKDFDPDRVYGDCSFGPLPVYVDRRDGFMREEQGKDCPCWESDKVEKCLALLKGALPSHITIPTDPLLGSIGMAIRILEGEE